MDTKDLANYFIGLMVDLLGPYRDYFTGGDYNTDEFLAQQPVEHKSLMGMVVQSQMFQMFIDERKQRMTCEDTFDTRIAFNSKKKLAAHSRFTMFELGKMTREELTRSLQEQEVCATVSEYRLYLTLRLFRTRSHGACRKKWTRQRSPGGCLHSWR